jgi:integrase
MNLTEPIRDKRHVSKLLSYYSERGETRNSALVSLCVHTALRISDILRLTCDDVYDFNAQSVRESITITEMKTGKIKSIALTKGVVAALAAYFPNAGPGAPLILNKRTGNAISRVQAYRLVRAAAEAVELSQRVSCHSLRKTFGYHAWKSGVSPAVIMEIYNHSSFAVTKRYLGVTQDDQNACYLGANFSA